MQWYRLTTTPYMGIHLARVVRDLLQASRVATLPYFRELGFDLVHSYFHIDDRFGGVEEATVARPGDYQPCFFFFIAS